ncbi:MAG: hypothetical protein MJ227_02385 [Bacilli bacterium]|nr:hypothetical protein [Bacilli bacterium]
MNKDKRAKAKEEKENHPLKQKIKVLITLFLCLVVVLLTATYITYLVTHKDKNRNSNTYNENSSVSLIEKSMIDAFSNTKDTGKFSFSLSDSDINQMIKNASDHVLNNKSESMYYESKDGHHYFYIDLKPKLFVSTRVVIDTSIVRVTTSNEVMLQINKVSMGKLPYIKQVNYLNEDFFNKLSEYSLLPIKYSKSTKTIITYPYKLMEYFPSGEYMDILKELIYTKPQVIKASGDSLFGFDIDFSSFRSSNQVNQNRSEEVIDLKERVESSINEEFLDSIPSGESKVACSFSLGELNRLIYNSINVLEKEIYEHSLTENKCILGITDVFGYVESGNFIYRVVFSINGYEIDFDIKSEITEFNTGLRLTFFTGVNVECGGCEFTVKEPLSICIRSYLEEVLTDFASKYDYLEYRNTNQSLTFDFSYIEDSILSLIFYESKIHISYLELISFDFLIAFL